MQAQTAGFFKITDSSLLATNISFAPASARLGGSFTAMFSGTNLTDATYFDIRFRSPGSNTDQVALNWQRGIAASHGAPDGIAAGSWIINGVRAHQDEADHTGSFIPVSATITVSP